MGVRPGIFFCQEKIKVQKKENNDQHPAKQGVRRLRVVDGRAFAGKSRNFVKKAVTPDIKNNWGGGGRQRPAFRPRKIIEI